MNSTKKTARIAGVLYLVNAVTVEQGHARGKVVITFKESRRTE